MALNSKAKILLLLFTLFISSISYAENLCITEQRLPSMGSFFELQIAQPCIEKINSDQFVKIQQYLDQIEKELSLYQTASSINVLNQTGQFKKPSPHLITLVPDALEIGKNTNGAFDISIWPVLQLIQTSFKNTKKSPSEESLNQLKNTVDYKSIKIESGKIFFNKKEMGISLDGIAKGYAVDQISQILMKQGFKHYLLNFSGNMRWQGLRPDQSHWRIKLWNPISKEATIPIATKNPGAIASSSAENSFYSEDKKWHHIINPKTLTPPNHWSQMSVSGPSAMICDALSTAFFVLTETEIKQIIKDHYSEYAAFALSLENQLIKL